MFLTRSGFKKLINSACKGAGLYVSNTEGGYQIFGDTFNLWIKWGEIPKESLGDLVSLVGELPEPGEALCAKKQDIQYEMEETFPPLATDLFEAAGVAMEPTRALLVSSTYIRLFQNNQPHGGTIPIDERLYNLISGMAVDTKHGEETPVGPMVREIGPGTFDKEVGACWKNNIMAISLRFGDTSQVEDVLSVLKNTRIPRTFEEARR